MKTSPNRSLGGSPAGTGLQIKKVTIWRCIEFLALVFYLCLIYKQGSIGILVLCLLILFGLLIPFRFSFAFSALGIATALYLAMSTTTAFLVNFNQGAYRTAQFLVLLAAFLLLSSYMAQIDSKRRAALYDKFVLLTILIFCHMIAYHVLEGHFTTWKYLFDTKTTISIMVVVVFIEEDRIKKKLGVLGWLAVLLGFSVLLLCSGERKAYILFAVLFLLSRSSIIEKTAVAVLGATAIFVFVAVFEPGGYVARQVDSLFSEKRQMHISEFYDGSTADQSDLIRDFVNRNAWQIFLENPLLGIGANGYAIGSLRQFDDVEQKEGLATNVHGEANRVPVEGGIVGIAVALTYLTLLSLAVGRDFIRSGLFRSRSADRASLYAFCFVFLYLYVEALDTLMLSIIVLFGLHMARVSASFGIRKQGSPQLA